MPGKNIVIHVDLSHDLPLRAAVAARLAHKLHATVTGVFAGGASHPADCAPKPSHDAALNDFVSLMHAHGIDDVQPLFARDDPAGALATAGKNADIVILSHRATTELAQPSHADFCEFVILNVDCPVLVMGRDTDVGHRVIIAWNASAAAERAVHHAVCVLEQAGQVTLATFGVEDPDLVSSRVAILSFLKARNIRTDVRHAPHVDNAGDGLLAAARELHADLIVMGGIAHPRWHGRMGGGTTYFMLANSDIALLMCH